MKSFNEADEYDNKELAKLKGEPWMRELLDMNPEISAFSWRDRRTLYWGIVCAII